MIVTSLCCISVSATVSWGKLLITRGVQSLRRSQCRRSAQILPIGWIQMWGNINWEMSVIMCVVFLTLFLIMCIFFFCVFPSLSIRSTRS